MRCHHFAFAVFVLSSCFVCYLHAQEGTAEDEHRTNRELVAEILKITEPKEFSFRSQAIANLRSIKENSHSQNARFSADYLICEMLWRREPAEIIYQPYPRLYSVFSQMQKDYPDHNSDQRMISLELKLHECNPELDYKKDREWLLQFLTVRIRQCQNFAPLNSVLFLDCSQDDTVTLTAEAFMKLEIKANPSISTEGAYNSVLKQVKDEMVDAAFQTIIASHRGELLDKINEIRKPRPAANVEVDLDQVKRAAGSTNTLTADERLAELRAKTDNAKPSDENARNYLLWLSGDGMKLTSFGPTCKIREYELAAEIYWPAIYWYGRPAPDNVAGWSRLAVLFAKVKACDSVIWMAENAVVQAEKKANHSK